MVTPQQLMDLPSAGMAEKQLRKAGLWRLTIDDTERIEWLDGKSVKVKNTVTDETLIDTIGNYWGGGIRGLIDNAATLTAMEATCN